MSQVKKALWAGGIQRSNKPEGRRASPGLKQWSDLVRDHTVSSRNSNVPLTHIHCAIMCSISSLDCTTCLLFVPQELIYAGQRMRDDTATMASYHVPPGCQVLIAIERAKLEGGKPDPDSAYWN